ncbi:hypothetical protein VTO42DRAFT_1084 [Malbranchea cinnamomea]
MIEFSCRTYQTQVHYGCHVHPESGVGMANCTSLYSLVSILMFLTVHSHIKNPGATSLEDDHCRQWPARCIDSFNGYPFSIPRLHMLWTESSQTQ